MAGKKKVNNRICRHCCVMSIHTCMCTSHTLSMSYTMLCLEHLATKNGYKKKGEEFRYFYTKTELYVFFYHKDFYACDKNRRYLHTL